MDVNKKVDVTHMLKLSSSFEDLNPECQLSVIHHTWVQQYVSTACSVCEVKANAEAVYWGTFVVAMMLDLCVEAALM